ncbi:putative transmembrane protein [Gregarina niphandrodes]|uniref:Transmembrane protein n=1 Tax=Gregarina niphandrodes TaxID=110365 RepID=A0A023BBY9_GRENI|nr:putative transmembrane protein [Gregarina niphandrodes]EZG81195.1 putative transmembrane protein [Gregarina niphandrodes]|eukprot:XP_011134253.1 putative transmembrane protein [Gregarina niphandrodes]
MRGSWNHHAYYREKILNAEQEVEKERQRKQMVLGVGMITVMLTAFTVGLTATTNYFDYNRAVYPYRIMDSSIQGVLNFF